ncbi:hypothetical protein Ancab_010100 [Ancistrocladus abbreviatus]
MGFGYDVPAAKMGGRISPANNTFTNLPPPTADPVPTALQQQAAQLQQRKIHLWTPHAAQLKQQCPKGSAHTTLVATADHVDQNATDSYPWRSLFAAAMVTMAQIGSSLWDGFALKLEKLSI